MDIHNKYFLVGQTDTECALRFECGLVCRNRSQKPFRFTFLNRRNNRKARLYSTPKSQMTALQSKLQGKSFFGVFRGGMNHFLPIQLQERRLCVYAGPAARCGCVMACGGPVFYWSLKPPLSVVPPATRARSFWGLALLLLLEVGSHWSCWHQQRTHINGQCVDSCSFRA